MNKKEFLQGLRDRLNAYPKEELDRSIGYWSEMVEDRIEDGATEEEAVASLGDIDEIAKQIEYELPLKTIIQHSGRENRENGKTKRKGVSAWIIVLLVVGAPLWLPIGLSVLLVLFALLVAIWAIDISLWAVMVSGAACVVAGIASIVFGLLHGVGILALLGAAVTLAGAGIGILMFLAAYWFAKGIIALVRAFINGIKKSIVKNRRS